MPEVGGPSPFPGRADPEVFNLPELLTRLPVPRPGDDNAELTELHRRDQDDRRGPGLPDDVDGRDRARRERAAWDVPPLAEARRRAAGHDPDEAPWADRGRP
jgi:hypothetical protein